MDQRGIRLRPDEEQALVSELAELAIDGVAPEELPVFEETAAEYFKDPSVTLAAGGRDEAVGFGVEFALLTPYVLAVVTPVVRSLASLLEEELREQVRPSVAALVRRVFRRSGSAGRMEGEPALTPTQAGEVWSVAKARAGELGLDADRAELLADAIVGRLLVRA